MAGLFDDLIPAQPGAPPAVAAPKAASGLFDDLIPPAGSAPPLTIQGPGNVQAAAAASFDPEGTGAQNYDTPADPNATPGQRIKGAIAAADGFASAFPFSDRLAAAAASATGWGATKGDYAGNLAQLHSEENAAMAAHPVAATVGGLAGGAVAGTSLLKGLAGGANLVADIPVAGRVVAPFVNTATPGGKILAGTAAGAGIGGTYGLSGTPDLTNVPQAETDTLKGAELGTAAGAAVPIIGAGAGAVYRGLSGQSVPQVMGPNGPISAEAQKLIMKGFNNDDPAQVMANAAQYGDQGTLLDYGPGLRGLGQGLAVKPGPAQQAILGPLAARDAGANARIGVAVDSNLDPSQSPLVYQENLTNQSAPFAQTQQQAIRAAGPVDISDAYAQLKNALPNAAPGSPEHTALSNAVTMLGDGETPTTNAQRIYSARQALDDKIDYKGLTLDPPSAAMKSQQGAFQTIRGSVSDALKRQVPGYEDATDQISNISKQADALKDGTLALKGGDGAIRPDDFAANYNSMTPEQQAAYRVSMRNSVDAALGTKANDLQALKGVTQGDNGWNSQKLGTAYGQDLADALNSTINNESKFKDTYNRITNNSETARSGASIKAIEDAEGKPFQFGETRDLTVPGAVATAVKIPTNALLRALWPKVDNGPRDTQIAQILTAQGDQRNQMLAKMLDAYNVQQQNNAALGAYAANNATKALAALSPSALAAVLRAHPSSNR